MALDRLDPTGPLGAYLDTLADVPPAIAARYAEVADDPDAEMMTHPELGRLLRLLVRLTGGRAVIEVGTFVGISAAWMADALSADGRLDTLEVDPATADRAERWFTAAGIADRIRVHRGPAAGTLARLPDAAYDLCYIDADKPGYMAYLDHAVRVVRPGGAIVADNVLAGGRVAAPADDDENARALRAFTRVALDHHRLDTTVLTVGDGVTLSVVRREPDG